MEYSIIIPINNEQKTLPLLLKELKPYSFNNEILFVDDGSNDLSNAILKNCSFINLITLNKNRGKGYAIRKALIRANFKKIIIMDGDLELKTNEIEKMMILEKKKGVHIAFGCRYKKIKPFNSLWNFGNYIFIFCFNFLYKKSLNDVLCCSKSFFIDDIDIYSLKSNKFDIDIELTSILVKKFTNYKEVMLSYSRRSKIEGKKLRLVDAMQIFYRMVKCL